MSHGFSPNAEFKIVKYFLFWLCFIMFALSLYIVLGFIGFVYLIHVPGWETICLNQSTSCLLDDPKLVLD